MQDRLLLGPMSMITPVECRHSHYKYIYACADPEGGGGRFTRPPVFASNSLKRSAPAMAMCRRTPPMQAYDMHDRLLLGPINTIV